MMIGLHIAGIKPHLLKQCNISGKPEIRNTAVMLISGNQVIQGAAKKVAAIRNANGNCSLSNCGVWLSRTILVGWRFKTIVFQYPIFIFFRK